MQKTEERRVTLELRRNEAARAWDELRGTFGRELGWRPGKRLAGLLAASAVGLAFGWSWRRRRR